MEKAFPALDDVVGQQDLADQYSLAREQLVPFLHEQTLTDGGAGLDFFQIRGAFFKPQEIHAEPDGAARHNRKRTSLVPETGDILHESVDPFLVDVDVMGKQHFGAELEDDLAGFQNIIPPFRERVDRGLNCVVFRGRTVHESSFGR